MFDAKAKRTQRKYGVVLLANKKQWIEKPLTDIGRNLTKTVQVNGYRFFFLALNDGQVFLFVS